MKTSSTNKLLTSSFIKVCFANLFLFFSLYITLPIALFEVQNQIPETNFKPWTLLLCFILGLIVCGPFHNLLIENFNRKRLTNFTFLALILVTANYLIVSNYGLLLCAIFIHGALFGLATAASITIAIDITHPKKRSKGNIIYAWLGRLGMVLGVPLGVLSQTHYGFDTTLYLSIGSLTLALLLMRITHSPFRAPMNIKKLSLDRFILPQGWRLILIMIALAFIPGALFPHFMTNLPIRMIYIESSQFTFVALPFIVFLLSAILSRLEIDALLNRKSAGFLLTRLPLLIIGTYFLVQFYAYLSNWTIWTAGTLIASYILAIGVSIKPNRNYLKSNKWTLEPQYRLEVTSPILSGLLCITLALLLEYDLQLSDYQSYVLITQLLLFGLARVSSPVFLLIILSSKHCERGTANTSHHLGWEVGLALGAITTLALDLSLNQVVLLGILLMAIAICIYFYIYFKLHKLAEHRHH